MTENNVKFPYIEPWLKRQQSQVDFYIEKLGITNLSEEFILKCLLSLDWNRRVIVSYIDEIKLVDGMVRFKFTLTAPSRSIDYCCSDPFREEGWSGDCNSVEKRMTYVKNTFDRYCQ